MDFSTALIKLKEGKKMARSGWKHTGNHIEIDEGKLFMVGDWGFYVWIHMQEDILAEDWYEIA